MITRTNPTVAVCLQQCGKHVHVESTAERLLHSWGAPHLCLLFFHFHLPLQKDLLRKQLSRIRFVSPGIVLDGEWVEAVLPDLQVVNGEDCNQQSCNQHGENKETAVRPSGELLTPFKSGQRRRRMVRGLYKGGRQGYC